MNYPVYCPTQTTHVPSHRQLNTTTAAPEAKFQSTSTYHTAYYASVTPVGSSRPRRSGENDEDDLTGTTGTGTESGGSTISGPNGYHGAEATPIGGSILPLSLCLLTYLFAKFLRRLCKNAT